MKLLLDTHVLLWALLEPGKLSPELRNALEDSGNTLVVSAASAWEIATKWRLGKLQHAGSVVENYAMALHVWPRSICRSAVPWPGGLASGMCRTAIPLIACWRPRPWLTTSFWPAPIRPSPCSRGW